MVCSSLQSLLHDEAFAYQSLSLKIPIVQLIRRNEVIAEVIFNRLTFDSDLMKLNSVMRLQTKSMQNTENTIASQSSIVNVYDDMMLHRCVQEDSISVLKLFTVGCELCISLEAEYERLSKEYSGLFPFYQADVTHVPHHVQITAASLEGKLRNGAAVRHCRKCLGTGIETCSVCSGEGYLMHGDIAVICSECGGKKQRRCSYCEGRCAECG